MMETRARSSRLYAALAVLLPAIGALVLYLATISPSISIAHGSADSGELVSVASVLGVAHPPGYGLYLLLARGALETLRFLDEPALRTNVLSAVMTAAAIGTLVLVARRWVPGTPWWAAMAGAGAAAVAPTVWSEAILTEVYALHALLTAVALLAALAVWDSRRWGWFGLALGLLVAHHPTGWLVAGPLAAVAVWQLRPHPLEAARAVTAFAIPLVAAVGYLVVRSDAAIAWGDTGTFEGLRHQLSGADYRSLWEWSPSEFLATFPGSVRTALRQSPPPMWVLLPFGVAAGWRARPGPTLALATTAILLVLFVTVYRAEGREPYLIPVAFALGLAAAWGFTAAWRTIADSLDIARTEWLRPALLAAMLGLSAVWGIRTGLDVSLRDDREAEQAAMAALEETPHGGVARSSRDELTFPLWYLRTVKGLRPDTTIIDVRGLAPTIANTE